MMHPAARSRSSGDTTRRTPVRSLPARGQSPMSAARVGQGTGTLAASVLTALTAGVREHAVPGVVAATDGRRLPEYWEVLEVRRWAAGRSGAGTANAVRHF